MNHTDNTGINGEVIASCPMFPEQLHEVIEEKTSEEPGVVGEMPTDDVQLPTDEVQPQHHRAVMNLSVRTLMDLSLRPVIHP